MDNSPVYENFMNKMAAMQSKPKINATTMKIGGNGLERRVANNERKITAIKNIFKAQKIDIGEKIKPSNSPVEILTQTNETLVKIKEQLELDFINTKKTEEDRLALERKLLLKDQRDKKETEIETVKKNNKFIRETKKKILGPFQNIFSKLKELALLLGTGLLINNVVNLMSKPEFVQSIKGIFEWTTKNWKGLLIAAGSLLALNLVGSLGGVVTALKALKGIFVFFLKNPLFLLGVGVIYGIGEAARRQGLGKEQLDVLRELEKMDGGITKENKAILIQQKKDQLARTNKIIDAVDAARLRNEIKFLETGQFGFKFDGSSAKQFNFETGLLEEIDKNQFHKGGLVDSPGIVHPGEFVIQKSAVDKIGLEKLIALNTNRKGQPKITVIDKDVVDLTSNKVAKKTSMMSATSVEHINPINSINPYMSEVPILFGFNDLVYT